MEALGVSWAVFSHHFLELLLGMLSGRALGRLLEAPRLDLRWILKGLGGVWGGFWRTKLMFSSLMCFFGGGEESLRC